MSIVRVWTTALLMLIGAGLFATGGSAGAGAGDDDKKKGAKIQGPCQADADCVLVPEDCCDCGSGGKQRAIPKWGKEAYENARKQRCAKTVCVAMMSNDPSCSSVAACRVGKCVLVLPVKK